jgi:hypothetical protein
MAVIPITKDNQKIHLDTFKAMSDIFLEEHKLPEARVEFTGKFMQFLRCVNSSTKMLHC